MEYVKEVFAKGGGRDDKDQGAAIAAEGLRVNESVVVHGDEAVTERCLVTIGQSAYEGFGKDVGWV